MPSEKAQENPLEKTTLRVRWGDLQPGFQEIIGAPGLKMPHEIVNIKTLRGNRNVGAAITAGSILGIVNLFPGGEMFSKTTYTALASASFAGTKAMGEIIRVCHRRLSKAMDRYALFASESRAKYPKGWSDTAEILKTHPICYVAKNGDLVFKKPSLAEYRRYKWQGKAPGRAGFHPWKYRIFLAPPKEWKGFTMPKKSRRSRTPRVRTPRMKKTGRGSPTRWIRRPQIPK